jgi:hypothetical protein
VKKGGTSAGIKPNKIITDKSTKKKKKKKKQIKKDNNTDENKKGIKDKKRKEKRFSSMKEALNGISKELIKNQEVANATCWRCSHSTHYTMEYNAQTVEGGESLEKPTISAQRQRQEEMKTTKSKEKSLTRNTLKQLPLGKSQN